MNEENQPVFPEALPAISKLLTSMREQKGGGKPKIRLINRAIRTGKKQVKQLERMRVEV